MTGLIALSIALVSFTAGQAVTLLVIAILGGMKHEADDHDTGADEGDQTSFNRQAHPHPAAD